MTNPFYHCMPFPAEYLLVGMLIVLTVIFYADAIRKH